MAVKLNRAQLPKLHMPEVDPKVAHVDYDAETDMLYLRWAVAPAVSVNIDGEVWLRVDPKTGEVYGFEIEDYESDFLKRHHDLWSVWKPLKEKAPVHGLSGEATELATGVWRLLKDPRVPGLRFRR